MKQKYVATIEARMTSSRLPGKVLMPILGRPILGYLIDRLKSVSSIDEIVLATTVNPMDDPLVIFAESEGIFVHRGSEDDVLGRVIESAKSRNADVIVQITGDCPIIDPDIIEQCIRMYKFNSAKYVGNAHIRSYPDGMDVQVFAFSDLVLSGSMTQDRLDREHVSLHMRNNPDIFPHLNLVAPPSLHWPELGLTLDEREDFELLKSIIEYFHKESKQSFSCLDVIRYLRANPHLEETNKKIKRKGDS
ncbi:glycosyltransferase family protein [Leptospira sp. 201903070]|uniref:Glycosyltransferase family protein n=1 Tax=Leptospira ainlahdjerensis TaxID=2810033 RepID=A0ABS2UAE9_9LEPT|nr:glycosyltransferase family protein [Leptospira ainlahdjerensis]MBM9577336.1 glycosyltransferase family protein [Leptospira ainlahdjerensis]